MQPDNMAAAALSAAYRETRVIKGPLESGGWLQGRSGPPTTQNNAVHSLDTTGTGKVACPSEPQPICCSDVLCRLIPEPAQRIGTTNRHNKPAQHFGTTLRVRGSGPKVTPSPALPSCNWPGCR